MAGTARPIARGTLDLIALQQKRERDARRKEQARQQAPTHPIYDPTFPEEAVETQIAFQGSPRKPWYYADGAWHRLAGDTPAAIYGGDMGGLGYILLALGASTTFIDFSGLSTNDLDTFKLKGGSSPYTAKIPAGFYHWETDVDFQQYPTVRAPGTDPTVGADYGFVQVTLSWGSRLISAHSPDILAYPAATDPIAVRALHIDGYMNLGGGVDDLEVSIALSDVQNVGTPAITQCNLHLVRVSDFLPDESSNIDP